MGWLVNCGVPGSHGKVSHGRQHVEVGHHEVDVRPQHHPVQLTTTQLPPMLLRSRRERMVRAYVTITTATTVVVEVVDVPGLQRLDRTPQLQGQQYLQILVPIALVIDVFLSITVGGGYGCRGCCCRCGGMGRTGSW